MEDTSTLVISQKGIAVLNMLIRMGEENGQIKLEIEGTGEIVSLAELTIDLKREIAPQLRKS